MTQNTDPNNSKKKKKSAAKRTMSKDAKIIQTMKAYLPQLAPQAKPKQGNVLPPNP